MTSPNSFRFALLACALVVAGCGGGGGGGNGEPVIGGESVIGGETRAQDTRVFTIAPLAPSAVYPDHAQSPEGRASFTALSGHESSSRWAGEMAGAAYRVEVPADWNGELVMYANGYRGTGANLSVGNPTLRRYLLEKGYAWAASSFSRNHYDVRAGIEDTNALANAFTTIAAANGRPLATPTKTFITGHSMGGHIAAAAVEREAREQAVNKVRYAGAVPMCGVTSDMALFDTFTAMQAGAQAVAGVPNSPLPDWSRVAGQVNGALWTAFPSPAMPTADPTPTALGEQYVSVVKHLTGGERPLFRLSLTRGGSFASSYATFGSDGTVDGVLNRRGTDTTRVTYRVDGDAALSAHLNRTAPRVAPEPNANALRADGLRWVPRVNGEFTVPVVAIHTLGDLFVPFSMIQTYRQRAGDKGNGDLLVTRAIRGISHCDFTLQEQAEAFDAMVTWERGGQKPAGDDVLTPAVVADPSYGCTFTRATIPGTDSATTTALRGVVAASGATCP